MNTTLRQCIVRRRWTGLTACLLLGPVLALQAAEPPLTILAAASLQEVLTEVGALHEKETGQPVRFRFDAAGVLARQIEQGAPADVLVSDHPRWLDVLTGQKKIDPTTRRPLARNQLVLVQPAPHDVFVQETADLVRLNRIAMADPASDPAGLYARQYLEHSGVWTSLQARMVFASHVRAALALTERDEVGAALVYASDARSITSEPGIRISFAIPPDQHDPILYEAAILNDAPHRVAALKFFWTLETPGAKELFVRYGFIAP